MREKEILPCFASMPPVTDDAVGVSDGKHRVIQKTQHDLRKWFVAIVNHHSENKVAERLSEMGYECYVASQDELRIRANGRRVHVQRVLIPSKIFIHCTEDERLVIVRLPFVNRFMTNPATQNTGTKKVATVPQEEIDLLRFMLGYSDSPVNISSQNFAKGQRVRVVRGRLAGLEGEIVADPDGTHSLVVHLDMLGYAKVCISPSMVELET